MNTDIELAKPTRVFPLFGDGTRTSPVEVTLCGRNNGRTDWSIAELKDKAGVAKCSAYSLINALFGGSDRTSIYAPRPSTFNAHICAPHELTEVYQGQIDLSNEENTLPPRKGVKIYRGVNADGCEIPQGKYMMLASADCPTIIARSRVSGKVVAAHAGRDCLVDRTHLETGTPSRPHESVVDGIMYKFLEWNVRAQDLDVFITCGIGGGYFYHRPTDQKYGATNRKLIAHFRRLGDYCVLAPDTLGGICLPAIIRAQFAKYGVLEDKIANDDIDTFGDIYVDTGEAIWHSSARGKTPAEKAMRNLVVIYNRGS